MSYLKDFKKCLMTIMIKIGKRLPRNFQSFWLIKITDEFQQKYYMIGFYSLEIEKIEVFWKKIMTGQTPFRLMAGWCMSATLTVAVWTSAPSGPGIAVAFLVSFLSANSSLSYPLHSSV